MIREIYEMAYKEALSKAAIAYKNEDGVLKETLEKIFPELKVRVEFCTKEEYDNKEYLRGHLDGKQEMIDKYSEYDILAEWQKNTDWNKPPKNHSVLMKTIHGIVEGEWNGVQWIQYRWRSIIYDTNVLYWIELSDLEKQISDKDKSKFKVGDWVVYNGITYHIESVTEDGYCNDYQGFMPKTDEDYMRLWTIADAKDGDVLAAHEVIVLFKKIEGYNIRCHFSYHYMNHQTTSTNELHNKIAFCPATKEQRDILFAKMKEAGYEWDAEKKELKKIEQKPTEDIDAAKASVEYRNYRMSCGITDPIMLGEIESAYYEGTTRQISAKWSEEDKSFIEDLLEYFDAGFCLVHKVNDVVDWIKSLPQRFDLQPKQGWGEEDKNGFDDALWAIEQAKSIAKDENDMGNLWSAEKWLKTLKERFFPSTKKQ